MAYFDDPMDRLSVVIGLQLSPLWFYTGSGELYNQKLFAGAFLNDFPSVIFGGEAYDSYITIGNTFQQTVMLTPGFLGGTGAEQVILGNEFGPDADAGWYYNPFEDAPEVGMWNSEVVIAQFTVDKGAGFFLQTGVYWIDPVEGQMLTPFIVNNIPAPGVLVLLGLPVLVSRRRRRVRGC